MAHQIIDSVIIIDHVDIKKFIFNTFLDNKLMKLDSYFSYGRMVLLFFFVGFKPLQLIQKVMKLTGIVL